MAEPFHAPASDGTGSYDIHPCSVTLIVQGPRSGEYHVFSEGTTEPAILSQETNHWLLDRLKETEGVRLLYVLHHTSQDTPGSGAWICAQNVVLAHHITGVGTRLHFRGGGTTHLVETWDWERSAPYSLVRTK